MHAYDSRQHPYLLGWTLALILVNFMVFLGEPAQLKTFAGIGPSDTANDDTASFYVKYAFTPDELHADLNGAPLLDDSNQPLGFGHVLLTMVTAMFVHASWLHLLGNMLVLVFVGPRIEGRVGSLLFLLLYFASGIFGWFATYVTSPASGFSVGASGAVAGVMGAAIITDPMAWVWIVPVRIPLPLWISGLWFFATEFWAALKAAPQDTVAHWAHVGGIFMGFAAGVWIRSYKPASAVAPAYAVPAPAPIYSAVPHPAAASASASGNPAVAPSIPHPAPAVASQVAHLEPAIPSPAVHPAPAFAPPAAPPVLLAAKVPVAPLLAARGATPAASGVLPKPIAAPVPAGLRAQPPAPVAAAGVSAKLSGLAAIKAQGAPASVHPPIAPRTAHEAHVNAMAAKRIGAHVKVAQWVIAAISAYVLIYTAAEGQGGIWAGIGGALLTYVFLASMWAALEHLAAHIHVKVRGIGGAEPQRSASA